VNDGTFKAVEAQLRLFDDRIRDLSATLQKFRRLRNLEPLRIGPDRAAGAPPPALTDRELAILQLIAEGRANDEIAVALHFGLGTIKLHVREILDKLGVPTRAAAAARAVRLGLI
jgi:DNA-binding NarL/FixJ family response regulator